MANTKLTQRDYFGMIIELAEDAERQDIIDFCKERIEALNKKSASRSSAKAEKKAEENAPLIKEIKEILAKLNSATVAEIREKGTLLADLTPQKITPIMTALVEARELAKEKVKGRMVYTLVGLPEEEEDSFEE